MQNKKKIAIIYSGGKYWGGIETIILNLFEHYDKNGMNLVMFSLGAWPLNEAVKEVGGEVVEFSKTRFQPFTIFKIARMAKRLGVNLLVSGGLVADSYARAASLVSLIPHLSFIHSDFNLEYPNPLLRFVYRGTILASRWKTKHYIAVSGYLKERAIKGGIKDSKVKVIYNGIEIKPCEKENHQGTRVTSVGRLHKIRGYDLLIRAAKHLKEGQVLIYGEGPEKNRLKELIGEMGLEKKVKLMGYASNIFDVFKETDIYVQPSRSEGFGLAVAEAMAVGLPVVVTPTGSLGEIVRDQKTGIVSRSTRPKDIADAINKLILNPSLRQRISVAAAEYAKKEFEVKRWAEKVTDAFLGVCK